jgi:hypothetical protein
MAKKLEQRATKITRMAQQYHHSTIMYEVLRVGIACILQIRAAGTYLVS